MGKMHGYPAGGQYEEMKPQVVSSARNEENDDDDDADDDDDDDEDGESRTHPSVTLTEGQDEAIEDNHSMMERMEKLKDTLQKMKDVEMEAKQEFETVAQIWHGRLATLRDELAEQTHQVRMIKRRIGEVQKRLNSGPAPQGPSCLKFLEEDVFIGITSVVILVNMITMTMEVIHQQYTADLYWLDNFFLAFYCVELALKAVYYRYGLLCGKFLNVWSNWLDTIVVVVGLVDLWIAPDLASDSSTGTAMNYVNYLRIMRLARLARLLRLVKLFMQSDLAWAEGECFQSFIMIMIGLNAVVMGFEVEAPQYDFVWFYVNQLMLATFTFELVVRLKRSGFRCFFTSPKDWTWNWLDFIIVMGGVIDDWMEPAYRCAWALAGYEVAEKSTSLGQVMSMLRMARLLRILRLVRLIKDIPPLYKLVVGIAKAMQGMAWVMVLTAMVLYICALVGVKLVGPRGLLWGDIDKTAPPQEAISAFPDIWAAIFNLFKVMNADMSPMEGLFESKPLSKLFIGFYVVVTNWAIFSILTAVVSENMARVTQSTEEEAEAEEARENHEMLAEEIFDKLNPPDGFGPINLDALAQLLRNEEEFKDLCDRCQLPVEKYQDTLEVLCHKNRRGGETSPTREIDKEEFLKCLGKEERSVSQRAIMRLDNKVDAIEKRLQRSMGRLIESLHKGIHDRGAPSSPTSGI